MLLQSLRGGGEEQEEEEQEEEQQEETTVLDLNLPFFLLWLPPPPPQPLRGSRCSSSMDPTLRGGEEARRRRRRRRRRHGSASAVAALLCCYCCLFCLFSIPALSIRTPPCSGVELSLKSILHVQEEEAAGAATEVGRQRRELSGGGWGPGSYPPLCTAKCGDCTPCSPVHVAVPPGRPVIDEYYPEAWRCKCGNKLYMP